MWRAEDRDTERSWVNVVLRTGGQTAVQILVQRAQPHQWNAF